MQTVAACVNCKGLDSTEATGPDYDEIKDDRARDQCTHKESSGKLLAPGEKSVEEGHDYHTLMSGEEQVSTFKSKVIGFVRDMCACYSRQISPQTHVQLVNQVVNNYEVYQSSESGVSINYLIH